MNSQPTSIYYSDVPNLNKRTVTTYNGEKEYRANCRKIKGLLYVMGKSCFEIDGLWYRIDSGLIDKDYETGEYFVIKNNKNRINGVVGFEPNTKIPIMGFFTKNPYKNCQVHVNGTTLMCFNEELLIGNNFAENFSTGVWFNLKEVNVKKLQTPANVVNNMNKGYNIEDNAEEFAEKVDLYNKYSPELTKDVRRYGRMLGDTTYGVEIECAKGFLPEHIQNRTGIVICRDGSLNDESGKPGPEYVTIPLQGAKGLQSLCDAVKEISKRNIINLNCSLHIHIGNIPTTRLYLVSLYRLAYKIQNELFQMFPFYKTNPEGVKKKNYNQKLPSLEIMNIESTINKDDFTSYIFNGYSGLFSWLSEGYRPDHNVNRKLKNHPVSQKWNRHSRYYWLNFMNTIFSNRNTIEFRLHTPTTNVQKTVNWLFICNAIVRYANIHSNKILFGKAPITLNEILGYYESFGQRGAFLTEYLRAYVAERKKYMLNDIMNGDKVSISDLEKDKQYLFSYNGVTHLF